MKRDKRDAAFSDFIRARAGHGCERGHKYYGPKHAGLHCAHVFSRRNKSVRWDEDNAYALCFSCHLWAHGNPTLFYEWVIERMGQDGYDALRRRANTTTK